jgi:hypothetical protein
MPITSAFQRDANSVPIQSLGLTVSKTITYDAATTGATGAATLFTVTGVVAVRLFGVGSVDLTSGGAATLEAGIAGNTAALLAQTTATDIDAGEIWIDTSPATVELLPGLSLISGTNIVQTIATTTVTGGTLAYYCVWVPISSDGNVVAA